MAIEYAKVLKAQRHDFLVIGRGAVNAATFTERTGVSVITGGIEKAILSGYANEATTAIVSVGIEALYETSIALLKFGIKKILVEKPGLLYPVQIDPLCKAAREVDANLYIAYNRRFLASVRRARTIIAAEGGLSSFTFDFTEWSHEIELLKKAPGVKEHWIIGNSSHVIDLAFFMGGQPQQINSIRTGTIDWHPAAAAFVGCGITTGGTPFSYHADWNAPGRWGLEFCTNKSKLILRPMEKLQVMHKGSVDIELMQLDEEDAQLDIQFKPGLYRQVEEFLTNETSSLCKLNEFKEQIKNYCSIAGY